MCLGEDVGVAVHRSVEDLDGKVQPQRGSEQEVEIEEGERDEVEESARSVASWAQGQLIQRLRKQVLAFIPGIHHLELEIVKSSAMQLQSRIVEGAWLKVVVVSDAFVGLRSIDRHRLVQRALDRDLVTGRVQALPELQTFTCMQWQAHLAKCRIASLENKLRARVPDVDHLEIVDLSDGHAVQGFFDGSKRSLDPHGVELQVTVVSAFFEGKRPLARQQLVQEAFGPEILSGKIHALPNLRTLTPAQWRVVLAKAAPSDKLVGCNQL